MAKFQKTFQKVYVFTDEFLENMDNPKDVNLLKPFWRGKTPDADKNVVEYINGILKRSRKARNVKCVKAKPPTTFNGYYPSMPYIVWDLVCVSDDKSAFDYVVDRIQDYQDQMEAVKFPWDK